MAMNAIKNKELEKRQKLSKTIDDPVELDKQSLLDDEEIIEVIGSEIKRRKDSITSYKDGGRPELAEQEEREATILVKYMPEQLSEEEIEKEVKNTISEVGASSIKDMGKVIGAVMSKIKGKADGQVVSQIVKKELGV